MSALEERPPSPAPDGAVRDGVGTAAEVRADVLAGVAGASALAAGVIHLVVVPPHLVETPVIGALFLGLGLGQVGLGLAFRSVRSVKALLAVVVVHLTVISLYVASRTVELPFMPPHDAAHEFPHLPVAGGIGDGVPTYPGARIEAIGPLDLLCLLAELVLVAVATALLPDKVRTRVTSLMVGLAVLALVLRAAMVLA